MAFGRMVDVGSASARVIVDLSQANASVGAFRSIAAQINAQLAAVDKAMSHGISGPNAFGVSSALDQSMQKSAQAAQKLDQQRQQAAQAEQARQNQLVDAALKGLNEWAQAENKRHQQVIDNLQAEANAANAARDKMGARSAPVLGQTVNQSQPAPIVPKPLVGKASAVGGNQLAGMSEDWLNEWTRAEAKLDQQRQKSAQVEQARQEKLGAEMARAVDAQLQAENKRHQQVIDDLQAEANAANAARDKMAVKAAPASAVGANAFGVTTALDPAMQKSAQAAQKLDQQRQQAAQAEQARQNQLVDAALKGLNEWAQAENKRHQQMIDNLQAEANAANAARDKMGFKPAPALGQMVNQPEPAPIVPKSPVGKASAVGGNQLAGMSEDWLNEWTQTEAKLDQQRQQAAQVEQARQEKLGAGMARAVEAQLQAENKRHQQVIDDLQAEANAANAARDKLAVKPAPASAVGANAFGVTTALDPAMQKSAQAAQKLDQQRQQAAQAEQQQQERLGAGMAKAIEAELQAESKRHQQVIDDLQAEANAANAMRDKMGFKPAPVLGQIVNQPQPAPIVPKPPVGKTSAIGGNQLAGMSEDWLNEWTQAEAKLDAQRQQAAQVEQARQSQLVNAALKGLNEWAQAESKRHQQVIDDLQAEANVANAMRDKMGFKPAPALGQMVNQPEPAPIVPKPLVGKMSAVGGNQLAGMSEDWLNEWTQAEARLDQQRQQAAQTEQARQEKLGAGMARAVEAELQAENKRHQQVIDDLQAEANAANATRDKMAVKAAPASAVGANAFGVTTALDPAMQKSAQAAQKLDQQRQQAAQAEQARQEKLGAGMARAIEAELQAENKRHQQVIDDLQAEANAANALRDKMGSKSVSAAVGAGNTDLTQPLSVLGPTRALNTASSDITQTINPADVTQAFVPIQNTVKQQVQVITALLGQARNQIKQEMNLFQEAAAGTPASVSRTGVAQQATGARQQVDALDGALKALKTSVAQAGGDPQALQALDPTLKTLLNDAQSLAAQGFGGLSAAVLNFADKANASKSGLQGYFNAVRQGLEQLNESSLAANLQEVSFRLLPLGLGAGAATKQGIDTAQQLQEMNINLQAFTGSEEKADQLMGHLIEQAHRFGQPMFEVLNTMTQFAPGLRAAGVELDDAYNIAVRLATQNPVQGVSGALYAINEALSGQWRSVAGRFSGIPMEQLKTAVKDQGLVQGFDTILNQLGKTVDLAEKFGKTSRASFTLLSDSVNNFLAHSMKPFLDGMDSGADRLTNFFNSMSQGDSVVATLTGATLLLVSTLAAGLGSLGQFALGFNALNALIKPLNIGGKLAGLGESLAAAVEIALPDSVAVAVTSGFAAAASGISTVVSGALALAAALAVPALAVAIGIGIGLLISKGLEDSGLVKKGFSAPSAIFESLRQAIFIALSAVVPPLFVFASVVKNAVDAVGTALDLISAALIKGGNDLGTAFIGAIQGFGRWLGPTADVLNLAHFGGNLQARQQDSASRFIATDRSGNQVGVFPQAGLQGPGGRSLNESGQDFVTAQNDVIHRLTAAGLKAGDVTIQFVEGYQERIQRDLDKLRNPKGLGSIVQDGLDAARNALKGLVSNETGKGIGAAAGEALSGQNMIDHSDDLEKVYSAAISHMIETTRMLEDRTISANREVQDFLIQRGRAVDDFNRQQLESQADYDLNRAQQLEDFNRQSQQSQTQLQQQMMKQQADFDKQERRAQEDHLRDMQRLARGVDDAISALDFLTAQKTLQQMQDQQADYNTADQRRREDFAAQQQDLQDNLAEQQRQRQDDFDRQQQRAEAAYRLSQQRQAANFQLQQQREDQDRSLKLARQAQDYAIADARRQQDFNLQIAQLDSGMNVMTFIWQHGLNSMEGLISDFFNRIGVSASNQLDIGAGLGLPPPGYMQGPNGTFIPIGSQGGSTGGGHVFASGAWRIPETMYNVTVDKDELIMPAPYANDYRRAQASGGSDGGDGSVNVYIDARYADLNGRRVNELKQEILDGVSAGVRKRRLTSRTGRGF